MAIFSKSIKKNGIPVVVGCASDWILSNAPASNFHTVENITYIDADNNKAPLTYLTVNTATDPWMQPAFNIKGHPQPVNLASAPQFYECLCSAQYKSGTDDYKNVYSARTVTITKSSATLNITVSKSSGSQTFTYTAWDLAKGLPEVLLLEIQGAGGGGGGLVNANYTGGGGGAGAYGIATIKVATGHTITIELGGPGAGGYCYYEPEDTPGSPAADTIVKVDGNTVITVGGGKGGGGATASARGSYGNGGVYTRASTQIATNYVNIRGSYSYATRTIYGSKLNQYGGRGGRGRANSTSPTKGISFLNAEDYIADSARVDMTNYNNSSDTFDVRVCSVTSTGSISTTSGGSGGSTVRSMSSNYNWPSSALDAPSGCGGAGAYGSYGTCQRGQGGGQSFVSIWF